MLNPVLKGTKVSWRPHHTGDIYARQGTTMDNKFFICDNINFGYLGALGGGGDSIIRLRPILVKIYPLFNNNVHVKCRSNMIRTFWVKWHRNVSKCRPHHIGDIWTTRGNNLKTSFSYTSQNVKKYVYFGLLRGPWGSVQWSDWAYLVSSYPLTHIRNR